jgi:hemolysin activation/secretion protein
MTSMAHLTAGQKGARQHWTLRTLALAATVILAFGSTARCLAAPISDLDVKAAKTAAAHAQQALADATKAQAKLAASLKKAAADETELKSGLVTLQNQFAAAPQARKEKLSSKIRDLQEEANKAGNQRALLQTDLARAEAQTQARQTEANATASAATDLTARQKAEKAEWAQRQAQEKAAAPVVAAPVVAAPVVAAPVVAAPVVAAPVVAAPVVAAPVVAAPVVAAPVVAAPVVAAPVVAAPAEGNVKLALDQKNQADAVVAQRTQDLANAKDADARKKAEAALKQAERYAVGKDKDYQAAVIALNAGKQQPAPHVARVSEPAAWAPPAAPEAAPVLRAGQTLAIPEPQPEEIAPPGTKLQFDATMLAGDKDIVEGFPVWKEWADYVIFNPVSADEINAFHAKFTKALQEKGYVFARVTFPTRIWAYGIFLAKVDLGPLGTITVKGNHYYSSKQIVESLANQPGARFNYARVHGDIFDLNAKPDLNIDAKLRPSLQNGRRVIDADLEVEDSLPIHGAIELSNTGTAATNDWRIRNTLQDVNLTRHDDVLTAEWLTSPDLNDVNAYTLGYSLPLDKRWSLMATTGYSDSDIQDVLPQLDVQGKGYFAQAGVSRVLREEPTYRDIVTLSWLYQYWETQQDISGSNWNDRRLRLSMPSVSYDYQSRVFDRLYGRTFATVTGVSNFAGKYGSSEKSEFIGEGGDGNADGDFTLLRVRLARLQRFCQGGTDSGKWTLFMKVDSQIAGDSLPSAVRRSVGGANSVRGYEEGTIAGDNAIYGTLELRAPLFANFIPGFKRTEKELEDDPENVLQHRLQLLAFTDAGWVNNKEPLAGEFDTEHLASVGAGFRLGLTKYSQMRLDYGIPLIETTEDTPRSGRLHASLQLQF